jgi:hypothetical protein
MSFDLSLVETENGGDIQLVTNDLVVVNGIENQPYLAMFGGNKVSTPTDLASIPNGTQRRDFWGNSLFLSSDLNAQFNSTLERILNETELSSSGRIKIQNAIKDDLSFLFPNGKITVTVSIIGPDRIDVSLIVFQPITDKQTWAFQFKKLINGDWVIADFNNDFLI